MSAKTNPLPQITIGEILVLHAEFAQINGDESKPAGMRTRASKLSQLLDELVERRRKDAKVNG